MASILERLEKRKELASSAKKEPVLAHIKALNEDSPKSKTEAKDSNGEAKSSRPSLADGLKSKAAKAAQAKKPAMLKGHDKGLEKLTPLVEKKIIQNLPAKVAGEMPKSAVSKEILEIIKQASKELKIVLSEDERKGLHSYVLNEFFEKLLEKAEADKLKDNTKRAQASESVLKAKERIYAKLMDQIDASAAMEINILEIS